MTITAVDSVPRRQARSLRNDQRILDAAVALAADEGWAGLAIVRIAARSGLSRPTVMTRYSDRSHLAAEVWRARLTAVLSEALAALVGFADRAADSRGMAGELADAMRPFVTPSVEMCAAAELLIVGAYDSDVAEAVRATVGAELHSWIGPEVEPVVAARRAYLVLTALGLLLESRRHPDTTARLDGTWAKITPTLSRGVVLCDLPVIADPHWDRPLEFDADDVALHRLLGATLEQVGRVGYDAATVDQIAQSAGYTKGLVFSRYESKRDLFLDATRRSARINTERNFALEERLCEDHSDGLALATMMREFMLPGRDMLRIVALEQHRMSWHDPVMLATVDESFKSSVEAMVAQRPGRAREEIEAEVKMAIAQGIGTTMLAMLSPYAWQLPYQAVTVPLLD